MKSINNYVRQLLAEELGMLYLNGFSDGEIGSDDSSSKNASNNSDSTDNSDVIKSNPSVSASDANDFVGINDAVIAALNRIEVLLIKNDVVTSYVEPEDADDDNDNDDDDDTEDDNDDN